MWSLDLNLYVRACVCVGYENGKYTIMKARDLKGVEEIVMDCVGCGKEGKGTARGDRGRKRPAEGADH